MSVADEPPSGSEQPLGSPAPVEPLDDAPLAEQAVPPVSGNGSSAGGATDGAAVVWRDPIESVWSRPGEPLDVTDGSDGAETGNRSDADADPKGRGRSKSGLRTLIEWALVLGGALAAALIIQATFLKAFYIPSGSMEPTLEVNDRVLVNKLSYSFGDVQRGDIIVFHKPANAPQSEVNDFIKRVIALEGDTIEARDGSVYLNGAPLEEGYLDEGTVTLNLPSQQIPPDHVFVMGDNRAHSVDSRVFGPIAESSIVGEAIFRVWPVTHLGRV